MTKGIVLFAHNNRFDYYRMAVSVAQRAERFLGLPTTIITDEKTLSTTGASEYKFDNTILVDPDRTNHLKNALWMNKGRYAAYDLTPYDETLVLDSDYMINSASLLRTFEQPSDFVCYGDARYIFDDGDSKQESIGLNGSRIYWATVMRFRKTQRTKDLFDLIAMVENNYEHYADLYQFMPFTYRNDYALTIALRTLNGQLENKHDFIPGNLLHVDSRKNIIRVDDTSYEIRYEQMIRGRMKKTFIKVDDIDFHIMDKENFTSLIV